MGNPLFNAMQGGSGAAMPGNMQGLLQRFSQFKQAFSGDARQQVQQLLNSGKVTQAQYNQAMQVANELAKLLK